MDQPSSGNLLHWRVQLPLGHIAASGEWGFSRRDIAMGFASLALPFLFVTSSMLLFTNRRRAALGFAALILSVIALSLSSVVFD